MKHKVSWAYYGRWTDEEEAILKNTLKAVERNIIHESGITNYYNDQVPKDRQRTSGALDARIEKIVRLSTDDSVDAETRVKANNFINFFTGRRVFLSVVRKYLDKCGEQELKADKKNKSNILVVKPQLKEVVKKPVNNDKLIIAEYIINAAKTGELEDPTQLLKSLFNPGI